MQTWFECRVQYTKVDNDGRERNVKENYLIDAVSFTDAETRMYEMMEQMVKGDFQILNIKKSNLSEVFPHESGEWWYKAKISIITIDEKAGKEKKINQYLLIMADDIQEALKRLEEGLSYMVVPYQITALQLSTIADVFAYFGEDENQEIPENLKPLAQVESTEAPSNEAATKTSTIDSEDLEPISSEDNDVLPKNEDFEDPKDEAE